MKKTLLLIAFTISLFNYVNAQNVTITNPNGGEIFYSCEEHLISWNSSGVSSDLWNLDYSLDGGIIWTSIASNYLSANNTFLWTIPFIESETVLVRVINAVDTNASDTSDAFFSIRIPVEIISANGGETLVGNTMHTITWNAVGTSNNYTIQYRVAESGSWITIVNNYSTASGSYDWNVPQLSLRENCRIRIYDSQEFCKQDISDSVFTITPTPPILTYPNGGETLDSGCAYNIQWNPSTLYTSVRLDYSSDNGITWNTIVNGTSNDGNYGWTAPNSLPTSTYLIRISNIGDTSLLDTSDGSFTVQPMVELTDDFLNIVTSGCEILPINFRASSCESRFDFYYSENDGATWNTIATNVSKSGTSTSVRTYDWNIPNTIDSNTVRVRVVPRFHTENEAISENSFTITPSNHITVTSPNGGEILVGNTSHTITWSTSGNTSNSYTIQYRTSVSGSWSNIVTNYTTTAGTYNWNVPQLSLREDCSIRIYDAQEFCKQDISDNVFTITPAPPVLTAPNGGETLDSGCGYNIQWNPSTLYTSVRLDYSSDNGVTWNTIVNGTSNDGSYGWTTPNNLPLNTYIVRISNVGNTSLLDTSDSTFSIRPMVELTDDFLNVSTNGCEILPINFRASSCESRFDFYYSEDNGTTWSTIATNVSKSGTSTSVRTYDWNIPNTIDSNIVRVKVVARFHTENESISENTFTISPSNHITITSPNGGETLVGNTSHTITWNTSGNTSNTYVIQYRVSESGSWNNIVTNYTTTAGTYIWDVPQLSLRENCSIRIYDAQEFCKQDISDNVFTITPAPPVLTYPNGGETLDSGCAYNIQWDSSTLYTTVRLDYSPDNGITWNTIVNGTSNDGVYGWTTPNSLPTNTYIVRISNVGNTSLLDTSDSTFNIRPMVELTDDFLNISTNGCEILPINFRASSCESRFDFYYSENDGTTWNTIATNVSKSGTSTSVRTYDWNIPNTIDSNTVRVKVVARFHVENESVSENAFTISPSNHITVTSPNGGEILVGNTSHTITWSTPGSTSNTYTIQYRTSASGSWSNIVTNYTTTAGAYIWNVPQLSLRENCSIRIYDAQEFCKQDISDNVFTITPAPPVLTYPNGGETLDSGCAYNIQWDTSTLYTTVRLDYSPDNGITWNTIVNGTSNDGNYGWTTPNNLPLSTYIIRISNVGNTLLLDSSDSTFSIRPMIELTDDFLNISANGCETLPINFRASSCESRFDFYYSEDDGATWNTIATNVSKSGTSTSVRTYDWNIPNTIDSNTVRVKVVARFHTENESISDNSFTISPSNHVTVTSPNGGEILTGNTSYNITWSSSGNTSNTYTIQYRTSESGSWSNIVTNYTTTAGTYIWNVPRLSPREDCRIRVYDSQEFCKQDISDNVFTITPTSPVLTYPNGGETLDAGCAYNIQWDFNTLYTSVRLDYSSDNGVTWNTIVNGTSNDGNYGWTTPNSLPLSTYLIRISNVGDTSLLDTSDSTFGIRPMVELTDDFSNISINGCESLPINFRASSCESRFDFHYSENDGTTWNTIATNVSKSGTSTSIRTYDWNLPNTIDSNTIKVRVRARFHPENEDISDNAIAIVPSNHIAITSLNGGEIYTAGVSQLISWMGSPETSGTYTIQYKRNNTSSWSTIATNVFGTNYNWTIPNIYSEEVTLRILDANNTCISTSSTHFTILPLNPVLTSPNTNVTYYAGENRTITWLSSNMFTSTVRLDYSTDNGNSWINIITSTSNDGSHSWGVPAQNSSDCLIRVSNYNFPEFYDISDTTFTIKPAVTILTPQGGITATDWRGCTVTSITFDHGSRWNDYGIQYSINNGSTWVTINSNWRATTNPATYQWDMSNIATDNALVRVYPRGTSTTGVYSDVSDAPFIIEEPIKIISGNYGGILTAGSSYDILWESDGISNFYDIFYSTNNGATYTAIATNYQTSSNVYTWTVPNTISSDCIFKIEDHLNSCKSNTSEIPFSIQNDPAVITITDPNAAGTTLNACETHTIKWNETAAIQFYDIDYSVNNGNTWIPIATNYETTLGEYDWTIPNISSENVILRVTSFTNPSNFDVTDASFTIQEEILNTITIESSSQTDICSGEDVLFTAITKNSDDILQYQWKINGVNTGTDSDTFSSSALVSGDAISCEITTSYSCFPVTNITSNTITINSVTPLVTPAVTISGIDQGVICNFTTTTLIANVTNGGTNPSYQWKINNTNVGSDNPQFSTTNLEEGDIISCEVTSDLECVSVQTVTSNEITIATVSPGAPSIPQNLSGAVLVSQGASEIYTIDPVAGATSYEWRLANNGWTNSTLTNEVTIPNIMESGTLYVSAVNDCGSSIEKTLYITISPTTEFSLELKVFLQGAALNPNIGEESLMRDDLRIAGFIPARSPYTDMISCNPTVFNIVGENAIVDWIWVELRDPNNNSVKYSRSALLQRDGDIVDIDGTSALIFSTEENTYYIAIKHRNHLSIMSSVAYTYTSGINNIDFTSSSAQITYGSNAQATFGMLNSKVGMWAGNVDGDTGVQYSGTNPDVPSILSKVLNAPGNFLNFPTFVVSGYASDDVNMDGNTQYSGTNPDTPIILQNVLAHPGNFLNFSTYQIKEQLPENLE